MRLRLATGLITALCIPLALAAAFPEDRRTLMNAGFVAVDDAWPHPYENELRVVRSILLERFPPLRTRQGRDLILAIRQIANEEIRRGAKGGDLISPFLMIQSSVIEKTAEHSCQGINAVFRVMLAALSIESRAIGFYTDNEQEPGQAIISHAISDVLIEGRWEAMDPTFDVSILHNNRPVDWPTVYALVRSGQSITTEPGLATDKRQWERYALNLSRDMNYLVAIGRDGFTLPPSWDGSYRIRGVLRTNLLTGGSALIDTSLRSCPRRNQRASKSSFQTDDQQVSRYR